MQDTMQNTMQNYDTMPSYDALQSAVQSRMQGSMQDAMQSAPQNAMQGTTQNTEEAYEYSWPEQFYYFALFRTLNGPEATPGKDCDTPIDGDTYFTQADLFAWIREQNAARKAFLDGKASDLTANQIKVLDGVGFPWVRDSSERWDGHFQELIEYKAKHGHCNVPRRSCKLGIWVKNQRAAYHKLCDIAAGREMDPNVKRTTAVITPDQIKLLTDIGFQWKLREDHGITWDAHFERLKAFKEEHGHTRVTPKEIPTLGRWVSDLRRQYKRKEKGERWRITEEQFARLNELGFQWSRPTFDPEEKKRRKKESDRKQNEKKKKRRRENKLQRQKEAHAVLKKYLPEAERHRLDVPSPKKKSAAKKPKKDADARQKLSDETTKEGAATSVEEELTLIPIPRATADIEDPSVKEIKNDIDQRLSELRREEEERAKTIRKTAEDRRKSGRLVVSNIVKLAASAPADEGAADGVGEGVLMDEETGESPPGSADSNAMKLESGAPAEEGSADEARNGAEEEMDLSEENALIDEEAKTSSPGSPASNMAQLLTGPPAEGYSAEETKGDVEKDLASEVVEEI